MPAGRVIVVGAALIVLLAVAEIACGSHGRDDTSYRAGYAAASNGTVVREAMTGPGMTPSVFCDALVETMLSKGGSTNIVTIDFVTGCTRAVAEAME